MADFWNRIAYAASNVVRTVIRTAAAIGAANGGTGMTNCLPRTFERGQSARGSYLRRRACAVDRAVHDHWLLWRK